MCAEQHAGQLLEAMERVSVRCWGADWLTGLEYRLYQIVFGGKKYEGISNQEVRLMRAAALESDTWWHWPDEDGPKRISLDIAERLYG